jgi:replicative DNA helicase
METKPPPHNIDLEMAIIGDFIEYPDKRDEIMLNIKKDYFYKVENQQLYQSILKVYSENTKFDKLIISSPELRAYTYQYVQCIDKAGGSIIEE